MKMIGRSALILVVTWFSLVGCQTLNDISRIEIVDGSYLITNAKGTQLRVTPYGEDMIRLQSVRNHEAFYPDNHYQMVARHDWPRQFELQQEADKYIIKNNRVKLEINRQSLAAKFFINGIEHAVLTEKASVRWSGNQISAQFETDDDEHFTGLGHGYYARAKSLDLKGQIIHRNYGAKPIEQAPLLVPFYMSSKGYGVFLNSTFSNTFKFAVDNEYSFSIDDLGYSGRMDYFFIAGPELKTVLDNYTQLTGRPRLPQKAMFGLQLSDKGHDHDSATPSDINWWKQKIIEHRDAGYPLDHVVNDNRWRAAGGKRCESKIDWDPKRYPDPAAYQSWLQENGLVITLDFNRCIAQYSEGWQTSFNLPVTGEIEFPQSAPDLTNTEFRDWFWQVFHDKALIPELDYPGDALWIDEFDEQGHAPKDMILANGRSSGEMRNYWFFLISQALVEQGWDKSEINKRPFVWVRGMTAGAQRFATLWSGDIYPNYQDMEGQIRGMQLAGLSGFPYWGHDAGGFYDWNAGVGPDENMYQRWAMAFGSFSPIWKPHGMGQSRWPLDRSVTSQQTAYKFSKMRYRLMPYLYGAAHQAASSGVPMARAMILDYQSEENAWNYDLQYMWGDSLLVAPLTQDLGKKNLWLPDHLWYELGSGQPIKGDRVIEVNPAIDELPVYVKAGAIIPERPFALSTAFIDKSNLELSVYAGADGEYQLIEDDDITESYRLSDQVQTTKIAYKDDSKTLLIDAAKGSYKNAPEKRNISVKFFGLDEMSAVLVNGNAVDKFQTGDAVQVDLVNVSLLDKITVQFMP